MMRDSLEAEGRLRDEDMNKEAFVWGIDKMKCFEVSI